MNKVYAVIAGDYEERGIVAIFSSRELANDFAYPFSSDDVEIVEYVVDEKIRPSTYPNKFYEVVVNKSGDVWRCVVLDYTEYLNEEYELDKWFVSNGLVSVLHGRVWAKSSSDAINSLQQRRLFLISNDEWKE